MALIITQASATPANNIMTGLKSAPGLAAFAAAMKAAVAARLMNVILPPRLRGSILFCFRLSRLRFM
jgi:hypothetical protein